MALWNAAVIGLGKIGMLYDFEEGRTHPSTHVLAYEQNLKIELSICIDSDMNKAFLLQDLSVDARFFDNVKDAFCHYPVDIVSVCTPPSMHIGNIRDVMSVASPKIIFCEKPLATGRQEVSDLITLMQEHPETILIPNISRRWNTGLQKIGECVKTEKYGMLERIQVQYTRGIWNTGSHLFDLLYMWTGKRIVSVKALQKVYTSSEKEGENSYSFSFKQEDGVYGYANAMNDENYYLFEIELFFERGKIVMHDSGDDVCYYTLSPHHLFAGFMELDLEKRERGVLRESCIANAVDNMVKVLEGEEQPHCLMEHGIYPLYVAEAIEKSYQTNREVKVMYI